VNEIGLPVAWAYAISLPVDSPIYPPGLTTRTRVSQVDLAQVEGVQRRLLLVGDQLVCFACRDDDDTSEGQIMVRRTHLVHEPGRAADADNLRSVGHGSLLRSNGK
jgi:hypothetical protein